MCKLYLTFVCFVFHPNIYMVNSSHPSYDPSNTNFSSKPLLNKPIRTIWPLQESYPNSRIENLNEYLSAFSGCLVILQNFQGIDLDEWMYPVYLTRFDIAGGTRRNVVGTFQFFYGRVPSLQTLTNESYDIAKLAQIKNADPLKFRWKCFVKFDIFFPEIKDAFHFYYHYSLNYEKNILEPGLRFYWDEDCN